MPVKFFLEDYLGSLERTMQLPPNFSPRGGGKPRGYKYTAADCDCRYCIHAPNVNKYERQLICSSTRLRSKPRMTCGINMTDCPCFTERLENGSIPLTKLLASLLADIQCTELHTRIHELMAEMEAEEMFFTSAEHKSLFNRVIRERGLRHSTNAGFFAALFLLTSNSFLWSRTRHAVRCSRISFEDVSIRGITEAKIDNYAIYKAAKELCAENGEHHITAQELADESLVGKNTFRLIANAMLIKRYGLAVMKDKSYIFS